MMQHIIKRQVIDLTLHKKLDAFSIQQTVSDYYYAKILPLLLQAFDTASSEEETITIDCLEIDVGTLGIKELEKGDWDQKIFKNISEQLIPINFGLTSQVKAVNKSRALSIADQWLFYMRRGYFSWNVLDINEGWYKNVLEAFAAESAAIIKLRGLINDYPGSIKRIVSQHSENFLKALTEALTAENQKELIYSINEIVNNSKKDLSLKNEKLYSQKLWEQVIKLAASDEKNLTTSKITDVLIQKINDLPNENSEQMKEIIEQDKNVIERDGIFVSNAGIVLLHPFCKQLFKNLQLTNENGFIDLLSHQKALSLLHYLATENTTPGEHELVIAKILCAFPLEYPVDGTIELTADELREADSVLESAIGQWDILKGTSPNGLRESFLQRKGKLFTKNGSLVLQVEQSSIDMLLDHLPWNLSIVKLPWMKDILKVEWR